MSGDRAGEAIYFYPETLILANLELVQYHSSLNAA